MSLDGGEVDGTEGRMLTVTCVAFSPLDSWEGGCWEWVCTVTYLLITSSTVNAVTDIGCA